MARLMSGVSLVIGLTVALAVIVPADGDPFDLGNFVSSVLTRQTKSIEQIEREMLRQDMSISVTDLQRLGKFYVGKLTRESSTMKSEELDRLIAKLDFLEDKYASIRLGQLGLSEKWRYLVSVRKSVRDCSSDIILRISSYASEPRSNPDQYRFALVCFRHFLVECDYESKFTKMATNMRPEQTNAWNWETYPTLDSYLVAEFWPKMAGQRSMIEAELLQLLRAVEKLSELKGIPEQADCTKALMTSLLNWSARIRNCPELQELVSNYFAFYLGACGFETSFEQMIGGIKPDWHEAWDSVAYPTLYKYLREEFLVELGEDETEIEAKLNLLVPIFDKFYGLAGVSQEADCTSDLQTKSINWLVDSFMVDLMSHKLVKTYFALYLDKCGFEGQFRKRIVHMKQVSHGRWKSDLYSTLHSYILSIRADKMHRGEWIERMLADFRGLSVLDDIDDESDCTDGLKDKLLMALEYNSPSKPQMLEIMKDYFSLYLDKCGFEAHFKKAVHNTSTELYKLWDSYKYQTLYSYFMNRELEHRSQLRSVLAAIRELPTEGSISEGAGCSEKTSTILAQGKESSQNHYPQLASLFQAIFKTC